MIILASGSPRRHELLRKLCNDFIVEVSDAQEVQQADDPKNLAVENAKLKASSIAAKHPDATVIGADTIVVLDGEIFGKPDGVHGAEQMLARLSGRRHEVITGLAICAGGKVCVIQSISSSFIISRPLPLSSAAQALTITTSGRKVLSESRTPPNQTVSPARYKVFSSGA